MLTSEISGFFWGGKGNETKRNKKETKLNGTKRNRTERRRPRADVLLIRCQASLVNYYTTGNVEKKCYYHILEKRIKLQARHFDCESTRRILASDVKQNRREKRVGRKRKKCLNGCHFLFIIVSSLFCQVMSCQKLSKRLDRPKNLYLILAS